MIHYGSILLDDQFGRLDYLITSLSAQSTNEFKWLVVVNETDLEKIHKKLWSTNFRINIVTIDDDDYNYAYRVLVSKFLELSSPDDRLLVLPNDQILFTNTTKLLDIAMKEVDPLVTMIIRTDNRISMNSYKIEGLGSKANRLCVSKHHHYFVISRKLLENRLYLSPDNRDDYFNDQVLLKLVLNSLPLVYIKTSIGRRNKPLVPASRTKLFNDLFGSMILSIESVLEYPLPKRIMSLNPDRILHFKVHKKDR